MATMLELRVCELLMARLCHDFAGPIAAIGNGAELLDDDDPEFVRQATVLIGDSAGTAAKRLQLFRFIYGFSPGAMAGPPPRALAREYFAGGNIDCAYPDSVGRLEPEWQRLACNLLIIAAEALPRGGKVTPNAESGGLVVAATGEGEGPSAEIAGALALATPVAALTSRSVGAYFAAIVAQTLGCRLHVVAAAGGFKIVCEASGT